MKFVALVISLLLERVLGPHERWRSPQWFDRYAAWMHSTFGRYDLWSGPLGVLLVAGVPTLAVALVYMLLGGAYLSLFALLFSILVLLFCLGPRELDGQVNAYLEAVEAGDESRAAELAGDITGQPAPGDAEARNRAVAEAVLVEFNDRSFSVLFWFVVLGPLGAILFRCASLMRKLSIEEMENAGAFHEAALRLHGILAWLPARLIALGYALAGSFEDALTDWKGYYEQPAEHFWVVNDDVLGVTGRGALRFGADDGSGETVIRSSLALTLRTLVFWMVLFGLLTIAGFAF